FVLKSTSGLPRRYCDGRRGLTRLESCCRQPQTKPSLTIMKSVSGSSVRYSVLPIGDVLLLSLSLLITVSQRYPNDWRWEYLNHLVPFGVLFSLWLMVFYITHQYELNLSAGILSYLSSFM